MLNKEEGGRHTPFFSNYRPQFFVRTADITGSVKLPEGTEMVMPGDTVSLTIDVSLCFSFCTSTLPALMAAFVCVS